MFKRILVPTDGSPLSNQALPAAITLGRPLHAAIHLLRSTGIAMAHLAPPEPIYSGQPWLPDPDVVAELTDEARAALRELVDAHPAPEIEWHTFVVDTDPAAAILDHAEDNNINLIVMASHGHTGIQRWALGSVTERVVRHTRKPVYIVRHTAPVRRMLIPLDGSAIAEAVLPPALAFARITGAHITLLHIPDPQQPRRRLLQQLDNIESGLGDSLRPGIGEAAEHYLQTVPHRHKAADLTIESVLLDGAPAPTILDYAEQANIDLIAMATHGRTGLQRWLYGSVTEKVLRTAATSLLIVRPSAE